MPDASWYLLAHSPANCGRFGFVCIAWQEKHDIVLLGSVAALKHGESISPLYSRPETRIIPSGQNESSSKVGSRATTRFNMSELPVAVGCTTKRDVRRSAPG